MTSTTATTKYSPQENTIPFFTTVDLASTASTDGGAAWITAMPCYNTVWIDLEITVATKNVTVTITPDATGGNTVARSFALTAGASAQHIWFLVNGIFSSGAVTDGSKTFSVTLTSTVSGQAGTCTGRVHLHGMRRY
jgi:hypothetical protein